MTPPLPPSTTQRQAPATAPRPPPSPLSDPLLRQRLAQVTHLGANAFLLALAAFQRGLKVTFHYEMASHCPRFAHLSTPGLRGELLTISDATRRHAFFRVLGDLTSHAASMLAESKPRTKTVLRKAGIDVPAGVVVTTDQQRKARRFIDQHPQARFLLKPVDASEGRGVQRNLSRRQVLTRLGAAHQPVLLEEFVVGPEYRVYVTGDRVVAALMRRPASVLGDGQRSVAALVEEKAARRREHSVYHADPLTLDATAHAFLAAHGFSASDVPAAGTRVYLNDVPSMHEGGDMIDAMATLPRWVADIAVRATQALDLPHAGLDIIIEEKPPRRALVLEANQNPYIRLAAVPMAGILDNTSNAIAESIIDHYFPASIDNQRHPHASFDFNAACLALRSGNLSEVGLPMLGQDWQHKRHTIAADQVTQTLIDQIHQTRLRLGIYTQLLRGPGGTAILDGVAPPQLWERFEQALDNILHHHAIPRH